MATKIVAISVAVYFAIAFALIASQRPVAPAANEKGIDFGAAIATDYSDLPPLQSFKARDGTDLGFRRYDAADGASRLIILVHGSAWHGMQFHKMAREFAYRGLGTVIAPDMRGHGAKALRRGDLDYIGQLEDDVADLIAHLTSRSNNPRIIIGGHSSGGGFVLRFAGSRYGKLADAYVLLAPFLKYDAPTTKPDSGGWAGPATRRIIGLSMLNNLGIRWLNHLPVITFAMPRAVLEGPYGDTATTIYTYRMNAAFSAHSDYEADIAAISQPLLVVAGAADESFKAELYEPTISAHTSTGTYRVLAGVNHIGVVEGDEAISAVAEWIERQSAE